MEVHSQFVELAGMKSWLDLQLHINYQVVFICNSSTNKVQKGNSEVQDHLWLHREFKVSLISVKPVSIVIQAGLGSKGLLSAVRTLRQKDLWCKVSLGYVVRLKHHPLKVKTKGLKWTALKNSEQLNLGLIKGFLRLPISNTTLFNQKWQTELV